MKKKVDMQMLVYMDEEGYYLCFSFKNSEGLWLVKMRNIFLEFDRLVEEFEKYLKVEEEELFYEILDGNVFAEDAPDAEYQLGNFEIAMDLDSVQEEEILWKTMSEIEYF